MTSVLFSFFIAYNEDRMLSIANDDNGRTNDQNVIIVDTIGEES